MRIAVPRETVAGETRVALVPDGASRLKAAGHEIVVEHDAGLAAGYLDEAYVAAGAQIAADMKVTCATAELTLRVAPPQMHPTLGAHEIDLMPSGSALLCFLGRDRASDLAQKLSARGITAFAIERLPRISRAQSMDALSSMSTVAGYKAVLLAAAHAPKMFPLMMTAAGTLAPSRVLVLGAGVAGLQAIATARRLGAVVEAFDVRPAVREEVESLGAKFLAPDLVSAAAADSGGYATALSADHEAKERAVIASSLPNVDVVITTALIPGRPAPLLVTAEMVKLMRAQSVIVDMAAEAGGNCALTVKGETVSREGVTILGPVNLPASVPGHASMMYSRNLVALVKHLAPEGALKMDGEDEIVRETVLVSPNAPWLSAAQPVGGVA